MLQAHDRALGRLEAIELFGTEVQLRVPIGASHGRHDRLTKLYLRIATSAAEGWSEVAAIAAPVGTDPSSATVEAQLVERWLPRLAEAATARGGSCPESASASLLGSATPVDQVAGAAVEAALLDAELRLAETSLASWLGVAASSVPYGGLVGMPEDRRAESALEQAADLLGEGASRLRVKIEPGFSLAPLRAITDAFPGMPVQADANGSFRSEDIDELQALDGLGLTCLEEPLAGRDLASMSQLATRLATPLCLDESIVSRRSARDALRYGACQVLCVKPARVGGLRATRAIVEEAAASSGSCFMGGMFETGLGRAYLGALSALGGVDLVSDVAAPTTYLEEDPCGLDGPIGGRQDLWARPGAGPWPAHEGLRQVASLAI
jgi:O-succinylbenzoate synthase